MPISETLIDVILANKPSCLRSWDHLILKYVIMVLSMAFCVMAQKRKQSCSEVSKMLSDFDELNKDLANAPWNVLEIYDSIDEQYSNWKTTCIFERV